MSLGAMLSADDADVLRAGARARRPAAPHGALFYAGALTATLAIGVAAAFVLDDVAASDTRRSRRRGLPSSTSPSVGCTPALGGTYRPPPVRPEDRRRRWSTRCVESPRRRGSPSSRAGAVLANPGMFIPIALKTISETDPSADVLHRAVALLRGRFAVAATYRNHPAGLRADLDGARPRASSWLARAARHAGGDGDRRPARALAASRRHRRAHGLGRSLRYQRAVLPVGQPSITPTVS